MSLAFPLPPFLIYFVGAILVTLLRGPARTLVAVATPAVGLINYFQIEPGIHWQIQVLGFELTLGRADNWSLIFLSIFTILSLIGILYTLKENKGIELSAGLLYAGSAMGVILAGDIISMFLFWEMLTVGAALCLLARPSAKSGAAALRYGIIHVMGGVILLAGILMRYAETGSLEFGEIGLSSASSWFIFIGIGFNCAWPVIGAWLTDTYPEASPGGLIFMATFTTKSAVYVLARTFPGQPELIWIGVIMATVTLFYAVIANDLRRVLAYCLINQVGFMVIGIGLGTDLSMNGVAAHAYCHILYKALLLMAMGAVLYRTGKSKSTDLGGLWKSMPWTCLLCCIGALAISFPYFCGFVSKSLILSAAAYSSETNPRHIWVWIVLLFASAGVFQQAGIRVPFFAFFGRDAGIRCKEAPWNMLLAMTLTAGLCIVVGVAPNLFLYPMLPTETDYNPYYPTAHITDQLNLLFFSALSFALLVLAGLYPAARRATNLDADWIYRRGGRAFYWTMDKGLNGLNHLLGQGVNCLIRSVKALPKWIPFALASLILSPYWVLIKRCSQKELRDRLDQLALQTTTGTWPIGLTAIFAVLLLAILFSV